MLRQQILQRFGIPAFNTMQLNFLATVQEGKDTVLLSPTGSGKTIAYLTAILEKLKPDRSGVQCMIVAPSRELSLQIEQVFRQMNSGFKVSVCYGGHPVKTEERNLQEAPAVLIGTPGRLCHHLESGNFDPYTIEWLVLDEFDKSLELGFEDDMSYLITHLKSLKQRILTSATAMAGIPAFTDVGATLVVNHLDDVSFLPAIQLKVLDDEGEERDMLVLKLLEKIGTLPVLVFCNQREHAGRVAAFLESSGLEVALFHGALDQDERERALLKFRNGTCSILVSTDLAGRGLDIPELQYIVHYQLPLTETVFIHRNGRSARMKASGTVYFFASDIQHVNYLPVDMDMIRLADVPVEKKQQQWQTLYIAAGKKDKIRKGDILGFLMKKGGLQADETGLIEVKDHAAYVAVKRESVGVLLTKIKDERLKQQKVKIEIAK